ncbi:MAG TPA: response regulator [Desulfobacterales bacterium]
MVNDHLEALDVLVVDDEEGIREGSQRILKRIGFEVQTAERGDQALKIVEQRHPAIVLLDLKMPGLDGMEVLGRIKNIDAEIQVIVITGYATVETAIEAMKEGAYDFIPKPFEPDQLRIVVNRAAEKIRLTREAAQLERERARTLSDLGAEKSRVRTIVESLPDGVLVTNAAGRVVLVNPACRRMLNLDSKAGSGEPVEDTIPDESLCRLVREISRGCHVDYGDIPAQEFSLPNETYLRARAQPVLGDRKECLGTVVNFVDITTMKVLDRLKSEFVAKVSHELRSPLSTIHEQLAVVIRDLVESAPQQDHHLLTRAQERTRGLISLIGDLLDLSRIEEGLICREPQPVQIGELLQRIIEYVGEQARAKNQALSLQLAEDPLPRMNADPVALESVFGNLITNAVKYTPEGGNIRVEADRAGINVRVRVIDNGFGIAEKYLDKIFERFYRVKDDNTRYITGTGLGLPIVKGLVDSMGGILEVESTPGEGSTFTVLLPTDAR